MVEINALLALPVMWEAGRFGEELLVERMAATIGLALDQKIQVVMITCRFYIIGKSEKSDNVHYGKLV